MRTETEQTPPKPSIRLSLVEIARFVRNSALLLILSGGAALGGEEVSLIPEFPIVEGRFPLTAEWSIELDQPHNRRVEDGSMVLWRPKFTIWINVWGNDNNETIDQRVEWIVSESSSDAFDIVSSPKGNVFRHAYRLDEDRTEGTVHGYYGYIIASSGHVQISVYFDEPNDLALAKAIVESMRYIQH